MAEENVVAAEAEEEEEEEGSLFQGMVLFTPSAPPEPEPEPLPLTRQLEENLFSELTLEAQPQYSSESEPSARLLSLSLSLSRKKKRSTVRIGYARDDASAASHPQQDPLHRDAYASHPQQDPLAVDDEDPHSQPGEDGDSHSSLQGQEQSGGDGDGGGGSDILPPPPSIPQQSEAPPHLPPSLSRGGESFRSTEDKLLLVRTQISDKLHHLRDMANSASFHRKAAGTKRRNAADLANSAALKHSQLESQLQGACDADDFEAADQLSGFLAAAEKDKQTALTLFKEAEAECDEVESKMHQILQLQIQAEEEGAALLHDFAKDAEENAEIVFRNSEEISLKEDEEWQLLMESMESRKMEIDINLHLISKAREGMQHKIGTFVEEDRNEKEILLRKRDDLAKDLDKLTALVNMKKAEISENESHIQDVDERISAVISDFTGTQSSIDTKYDELQSSISRIVSESEMLLRKKNEIDEFKVLAAQKRSKLNELAVVTADEAKTCQDLVVLRKRLASSVLRSREDKLRLAKMEEEILMGINTLRQKILYGRNSLQELSSRRASVQQETDLLKQRVRFIDKRGPELEAEKKVAANARNFKEAGRIAAEAKAINAEKESLLVKWEKSVSEIEKLDQEMSETLEKIQESECLILSKEKEAAMASYERLRLVAACSRGEGKAAVESGDNEEAGILLQEAEATERKARELQEAYSLEVVDDGDDVHGGKAAYDQFVSIAFITNLAGQHLAEMAASFNLSAAPPPHSTSG